MNDRKGMKNISFIIYHLDEVKKIKKNNRKSNIVPIKISENNTNKQKHGLAKKEKSSNTNLPNNKLKDYHLKIKENGTKLTEESQHKRQYNTLDPKDNSIVNVKRNSQKDSIGDKKEEMQGLSNQNKDIRRGMSVSSEKGHHSNTTISAPKERNINRSYNNSHSNERNNANQSKDSLGKVYYDRANSIDIDKKNNNPNNNILKIPLNMNNIHSFNINVITQTVSNQVNNFISTISSPSNQGKPNDNGSSSNLINLNSNNSNLNYLNNVLVPIKKKK